MPRKRRYSTEQIITKLREGDVLLSQGKSAEEISRSLEISKQLLFVLAIRTHGSDMHAGVQPCCFRIRLS